MLLELPLTTVPADFSARRGTPWSGPAMSSYALDSRPLSKGNLKLDLRCAPLRPGFIRADSLGRTVPHPLAALLAGG